LFQGVFNRGIEPHITHSFDAIAHFDNINQLFIEESTGRISNMVLIIYRSREDFGHWCGIFRSKDLRRVTYFNSYGAYIDKALDYIPEEFRDVSQQNFPFLLKLLNESSYEIHYNDIQLQVMDGKSATCGRWVGWFFHCSKMGKSIEEFVIPFESVPLEERDLIVVKLTQPYLS
jgi:hypothetical protein